MNTAMRTNQFDRLKFGMVRVWRCVFAALIVFSVWSVTPSAHAFNNPELLPPEPTNVIDLADSLANLQEQSLDKQLTEFEQATGWKLRVLTQFDQTPGRAVKEFWGLDDHSFMLIADPRGGNLLNFSVGDAFRDVFPRTFWIELQTRYGNQFFVRDHGEDGAIISTINALKGCLEQGGCNAVPGLPREQWILTFVTSLLGGAICGFAAHPRKPGQTFAWQWMLIFSPLWGMLFIAFGIGPVVSRTSDWLPLARNVAGFLLGFVVAFLTPMFNSSSTSEAS